MLLLGENEKSRIESWKLYCAYNFSARGDDNFVCDAPGRAVFIVQMISWELKN